MFSDETRKELMQWLIILTAGLVMILSFKVDSLESKVEQLQTREQHGS